MKKLKNGSFAALMVFTFLFCSEVFGQAPFTTTTTIGASGSSGNYTLTGTVVGPGTSTVYPTGSLSFLDTTLGGNSLGTATLGTPVYSQVVTQMPSLGDGLAEKIADNEVVAGDFNGDGKMDLALSNSGGVVEIYLGNGDGTFGAESKIVLPSINGVDNSNTLPRIAGGDFNGDGKVDLVVTCGTTDVCILLGNGNGTFQTATEATAGAAGFSMGLIAADFNGDGKLDLVLGMSGNSIYFAPGTGSGTFGTAVHLSTGTSYLAGIVSGDFNGDGHRDLIVLDGETTSGSIVGGSAWIYLGKGDGTFQTGTGLGVGGIRAAVGDFNGDGKLDVAFLSGSSSSVNVYLGNGAGGFTSPSSQPGSVGSYTFGDLAVGDFNGDGKLDIACMAPAGTSTELVLYLGTGAGTFSGTSYSLTGNGPTTIASADLNGDATPDLVIPNYTVSTTSIVLNSVSATVTATLAGVNPKGGGTHNVEASFPAEANYRASTSGTVALTGTTIATSLSLSPNPTSSNYGQQVSLSAVLNPYSYETLSTNGEAISFYGNGTLLGTANLSSGVATYQTTSLPSGSDTLTASFASDGNFAASSATSSIVVSKITPTITWATPAAITYGTAISATQLNASSGGVAGTFTYTPASGTILGAGTQTLSVTFNPSNSTMYNSATATVSLVVNKASTTISISSTLNPTTYGQTVAWPFTVNASYGTVPSGDTISYYANGSGADTTTVGGAAWGGNGLQAGTYSIYAVFQGDANYLASTSNTVSQVVNKATPTITWATPAAITYGTALSGTQLNATSGGVAGTLTYSPASGAVLNAGTQTLSVTFNPSNATNYNSASASVSLVVNKAATTISISSTLNPTTYGQNVSWPFTLSTSYGTIPSGDQIFYYANSAQEFNTTVGGPAWGGTGLNAGTFSIYAAYQGSANYLPSTSNTVSQVVNKATPTVYFTTDSPVTYGTPLIVDVFVSCGNACGNVDYRWDGSEWGTVPLDSTGDYAASRSPTDAAGTHTVQVNYLGDANHNAVNTTAQTVTINKAPTVAELTSSVNPLVAGATTTLSTLVDTGGAEPPTGTVTWKSNGATVGSSSVSTVSTTNLVPNSNSFTSSTWSGYCGTEGNVTANTADIPGPDGTSTATKIVTTNNACVNGQASGFDSTIPAGLSTGQSYVVSIWLRGGSGGESINLGLNDCASTTISVTTSWKRYSIVYSSIGSGVSSCGTGPRGFQVLENGIGTVYLWGAQTEQASALGPYVATGNGSATGSGGVAQLAASGLTAGTDALVATYNGDSNDLPSTSPTVTEQVNKTTPTITWATPAAITYGTALSSTQLNASSGGISGSFAYTPASGTILSAGTQTLSVIFTPTDTADYNTANATVSLVVNKAAPTITLSAASTEVYGTPNTASVHVSCNTSCGNVDYKFDGGDWGTVPVDSSGNYVAVRPTSTDPVGTHTIQVLYLGDANDSSGTSNTVTYTITKATPTITWATPSAITYGTALTASQLDASSGGVAGTFVYSPAAGAILNAGSQTLSVTFTPTDATDYNTATGSVSLVVNKATPTITLTLSSTTPTFGSTISATISVNCGNNCGAGSYIVDGSNTGNVPLSSGGTYVAGINLASAGTHTVQAQVVGNSNYNSALTTVQTVTVAKATPTITWATPSAITYGTALTASQLDASSGGVAGTFVYSPAAGTILNAGSQPLSVTFTPTDATDYNTATGTVSLVVNKATPTITLTLSSTTPTFGSTISATISVNCGNNCGAGAYIVDGSNTGNVPLSSGGTYVAGINFASAGTHTVQAQVVGNSNYNSALTTVQTVTVAKAAPTITWPNPLPITYGTALSSTQLNASSGIAGTFVYSPAAGTVLGVGSQTLSVIFTPSDSTDYSIASATIVLNVGKGAPTITVTSTPNPAKYGDTITFKFSFAGAVAGAIPTGSATVKDGSTTLGTITIDGTGVATYTTANLVVGSHTLTATYLGDNNYQ